MNLSDIAELNPARKLKKGTIAPFVEMVSLPVNARDIENISEKEFKGGGSKFKNNDTLFARITPCLENGKTAKVSGLEEDEIGFGSTEFIVLSAKNSTDEDYLYYLARLPEFRSYAQSRMEGTSGRQRVSWQALAEFDFQFPEANIREKSAKILKNFDDKIQLNNETNQTLEHITQAIFKSWFIDFDPVHSKANALAQGLDEDTANRHAMMTISGKTETQLAEMEKNTPQDFADLKATTEAFPSDFDDEGLPLGWGISTIGESFNVVMGQSPKGDTYNEENNGKLFFQGRAEFGWRFPKPRLFTTDPKRIAPKNSVLMSVRAPVGDINVALEECCIGRGLTSLQHKSGSFSFTLYQMKAIKNRLDLFNGEGTVFGSINQKDLKNLSVILPNIELIDFFDKQCSNIDGLIENNELNSLSLEQIRDTLLPKLLSGEIEV